MTGVKVTAQKNKNSVHNARNAERKSQVMATFLVHYSDGRSMYFSASKAGVHRKTIWEWRNKDADFDKAVRDAQQDGTDWYEDRLHDLAEEGNVAAIIFGLKMRGRYSTEAANGHEGGARRPPENADFTVEDLAQRAIDRGYITVPKSPKEIDGADIAKVE